MNLIRSRVYQGKYGEHSIRYFINNYNDGSCYGEIWLGFLSVVINNTVNGNLEKSKVFAGVEKFEGKSDIELQKRMNDFLKEILGQKIEMIIEKETNYHI